ncbi:hypothetical protein C0Z18_30710 [Trinickia dabaoshanensis]|uniref:Uncharacterized protein n=1 Tax=Trinickia dabaoshanensis TaxID=564714 RepID=A0A2N7VBS5_9BURK|nr:hypothetical protein C0Z18_30710 [Trinickia dabaoshanensis]
MSGPIRSAHAPIAAASGTAANSGAAARTGYNSVLRVACAPAGVGAGRGRHPAGLLDLPSILD